MTVAKTDEMAEGIDTIVAEVRKTKETADRMANGESPKGDADEVRVLAGLVHQVAEQVERRAEAVIGNEPRATGHDDPRESGAAARSAS